MTLRAIDNVVTNQALITGSVRDALTDRPLLTPATVELLYQATATRPARPYPLTARFNAGGGYVFAGNPHTSLPRLATGETLALRLAASAPGYQAQFHDFSLTASQLQRQSGTITVQGAAVPVTLLTPPLLAHDFALSPVPVHLTGRVVEADNHELPVANAQVLVTAPSALGPATTNNDGFFTLQNLPVALSVTIRVSHAGFDPLERTVPLDYRYPVNQQLFALTT